MIEVYIFHAWSMDVRTCHKLRQNLVILIQEKNICSGVMNIFQNLHN
jgi:hypothetical protein